MNPFPCQPPQYHDARASLHVAPLTDVHAHLHAPSDQSAVSHFVDPLIGVHTIYVFLLLTYAFSHSRETLTLPLLLAAIAPALVIAIIQTLNSRYHQSTTEGNLEHSA